MLKNDTYYKDVCKNLKKLRRERKLSQQQVADVIGLDRSTYAYYEMGKSMPNFDTMDRILKIFDINYYDLFSSVNDTDKLKPKNNVHDANLSKQERSLLLRFRLCSDSEREALLKSLGG